MNRRQFAKSLGVCAAALGLSKESLGAPAILRFHSKVDPLTHLKTKVITARARHNIPALSGVLVVNGKVVAFDANGFRKTRPVPGGPSSLPGDNIVADDDRFHLGSVMKVMTGYLVARMVDDGKIDWETKIGDVFDATAISQIGLITNIKLEHLNTKVMHLMSHSSGLPYKPDTEPKSEWSSYTMHGGADEHIIGRRKLYLYTALKDRRRFKPGDGFIYGGGSIIVAAMLEKIMGKTYEKLMKQYVFDPLGMTRSGFGPLSSRAIVDGPWEHRYDSTKKDITAWNPTPLYHLEPHAPAGRNGHSSIQDLGKFMAESMAFTTNNFVLNRTAVGRSQNFWVNNYSVGGWAKGDKHIWHTGSNLRNYSAVRIYQAKLLGVAAMSNVQKTQSGIAGENAVMEVLRELEIMHEKWDELFDVPRP